MAIWRLNNSTLLGGEVCAPWQANHAYALGARCVCTPAYSTGRRLYVYECTTAGTSHATTQPTWPTSGTVVDGGVTWTTRQPNDGNWDNASCFMFYIYYCAGVPGDSVYVHNAHNENANWAATIYVGNLAANAFPYLQVICVDKADDSRSVGAIIGNSGGQLQFRNLAYSYGVTYKSTNHITVYNIGPILESDGATDLIQLVSASTYLGPNGLNAGTLKVQNGNINFAEASCYILVTTTVQGFHWKKGTLVAPNGISTLLQGAQRPRMALFEDIDLTALGNGVNVRTLINAADVVFNNVIFSRCKLPNDQGFRTIWSIFTDPKMGNIKLHHCSASNRTYDFHEEGYEGIVTDETVVVRSGGVSDGTTPQSWRMISSAGVLESRHFLESPPIMAWCPFAVSKTFTIEGVYDSATNLQDNEIWMELECPANNTDGLGAVADDKCLVLGTPADKPASSEVWTVTGILPGIYTNSWSKALVAYTSIASQINIRNIIPAASISTSGARIRVKLTGHNATEAHISGVSIGERSGVSGEDFASAPTRITFKEGNSAVTLPYGTTIESDWITFTVDETKDYLIHIAMVVDASNAYARATSGGGGIYTKSTSDDDTLVEDISGYATVANYQAVVTELDVAPAAGAGNKFKCQVTTTPGKVGPVTARICLAKPNTTVYIDPLITVS